MSNSIENNKRIAKNTLLLYLRMLLLLCISLYTSRVVLHALGTSDYGIYNVVGGVVAMFSFLNASMAGSTQRFLNFDLASGDKEKQNLTFCTSMNIHIAIAVTVTILCETIGLWFLNEKMVFPAVRMEAANFVFQCSVLAMIISFISVPYTAVIISHEKMGAFAYISLLEAALKLAISIMISCSTFDRLKLYSLLLLLVSIIIRFVYSSYSGKHFPETKFHVVWNRAKSKEMGFFASWSLIGNLALMGVTQGLNIVLNLFFGPVVNAARGVAVQVQNAVQQFSTNFQTAINPQITKSYAVNDFHYLHSLIARGSKFSYLMVLWVSLPILILTQTILNIWLKTPPEYSAVFLRLIIINGMIDCLSSPLTNAVNATGKIKYFQLTNSVLMLFTLPLAYIVLRFDANPILVFIVQLIMTSVTHLIKLIFAHKLVNLGYLYFLRKVYIPILSVTLLSPIIPIFCYLCFSNYWIIFSTCLITSLLTVPCFSFLFGMESSERSFIINKLSWFWQRIK